MHGITRRLYLEDPYLRETEASVIATGSDGDRPFAVCDRTILYPEGGGQPADRGSIGGVRVLDVQEAAGEIRHFVEAGVPQGNHAMRLDWERRYDHMQQHTGQHLLTAVCLALLGRPTLGFHLGPADSTIDLGGKDDPGEGLRRVEERVHEVIRAALPVSPRWITGEEMASGGVRSRGLPEGFEGPVRVVEIGGGEVDRNTCGGTHLRSTAELQALALLGTERIRDTLRVHFLFGGRVLHRLRFLEDVGAALKERLTTGPEGFAAAADRMLAERALLRRRLRELEPLERQARVAALLPGLADSPGAVLVARVEGADVAGLQALGREIVAARPRGAVVLLGDAEGRAHVAALAGAEFGGDLEGAFRRAVDALGGRGGGRGASFAGGGPDPGRIGAAMEAARRA